MATRAQDSEEVGGRLRAALKEHGLSQRKLAALMRPDDPEMIRPQINKWANGKNAPDAENAARLSDTLGKPADYFLVAERAQAARNGQLAEISRKLDAVLARLAELDDLRRRVEATEAQEATNAALIQEQRQMIGYIVDLNERAFGSLGVVLDSLGLQRPAPAAAAASTGRAGKRPR